MSFIKKLQLLSKKKISDIEKVLDEKHGIEIATQEIRDAKVEIAGAIKELSVIGATKKMREEKLEKLKATVVDYEENAVLCIQKDREDLALDISNKICRLNREVSAIEDEIGKTGEIFDTLKENINLAKNNVNKMEMMLTELKVNKKMNELKATAEKLGAASLNIKDSYLADLMEQQEFEAKKLETMKELQSEDNHSIEEALIKANIIEEKNEVSEVLEKIKALAASGSQ